MSIHVQGHKSDFVHTGIGLNKSTGGKFSIGKMFGIFGKTTVHNCYGVGNRDCFKKNYWNDNNPNNGIIVPNGNNDTKQIDMPQWKPICLPSTDKSKQEFCNEI